MLGGAPVSACAGLQHYAALGRDHGGGAAVNLMPADKPQVVVIFPVVQETGQASCLKQLTAGSRSPCNGLQLHAALGCDYSRRAAIEHSPPSSASEARSAATWPKAM